MERTRVWQIGRRMPDQSPPQAVLHGTHPHAYAVVPPANPVAAAEAARVAADLGFDTLLVLAGTPENPSGAGHGLAAIAAAARAAHEQGLQAWGMLCVDRAWSGSELVRQAPPGTFGTPAAERQAVVDPRQPVVRTENMVRLRCPQAASVQAWWRGELARLRDAGLDGFAVLDPTDACEALIKFLNQDGFSVASFHSTVCVDGTPDRGNMFVAERSDRGTLAAAGLRADGWAVDAGAAAREEAAVRGLNILLRQGGRADDMRDWSGQSALQIISRPDAEGATVLVRNRSAAALAWPPTNFPPMPWQALSAASGFTLDETIAPGASVLLRARIMPPVRTVPADSARDAARDERRIIIARVSPSVNGGKYAVKTIAGAAIEVTATIFGDGHDKLAAQALTRAADEADWTEHDLIAEPNDLWRAHIRFARIGRHEIMVQAWLDVWGGYCRDLTKKNDAGQELWLEIREGRALIEKAADRADIATAAALRVALAELDHVEALGEQPLAVTGLLSEHLALAMKAADARPFLVRSVVQPVEVEREAAAFASWYEMFPRSQSQDRRRHGTFRDVTSRLAHVAAMGFDTLYFPPIHPIGARNRKGPNNALQAAEGDHGSPYAIGSAAGGHDGVHPELGTLEDFRELVRQAHAHGLEIALDFAIQCAPDHPWLEQHPGWFAWRPDGSIKYAENPPKKYQDIVNVDFYAADAVPDLWNALRDVVVFWVEQGVQVFRVDNPHTKPLPFWQWMIGDVKARHPEVIFLAEAFTRPAPMYYLAKAGFSQSYTYFTWRDTKAELTEYLTELSQTEVRDFFRPHFFVNTPDINPPFLQQSGRPGFLIRAALATTLSGLWGMYAGFELCESAALPGREEYLDSEKYELRPRPDRAPGDIVDEITQLNRLRRADPALQSHLGLQFHNAFNDNVLYYAKHAPGGTDLLLVAVSLDPHNTQESTFEVPLWRFGLPDSGSVDAEDLLSGTRIRWTGKLQHMQLTPQRPYAIWRIRDTEGHMPDA
jgi:starch synthase (maltosyl-transferring)